MDRVSLLPKDAGTQLELNKILQDVAERCLGRPAAEILEESHPSTDIDFIETELVRVEEVKMILAIEGNLPIRHYEDLTGTFHHLEIADYVLDTEALLRIRDQFLISDDLVKFFNEKSEYPVLDEIIIRLGEPQQVLKLFNKIFDEIGDIKDSASSELEKIRKDIRVIDRKLERVFQETIQKYAKAGYLSETKESVRNGRRVITVYVEHKRKVRGIIHDESSTGKTSYIEPEEVILFNNEWFDLKQEEKRAIHKVLQILCNDLRDCLFYLKETHQAIILIDLITAKAKQAVDLEASRPSLKNDSNTTIIHGYHPLLKLRNNRAGRTTIPFTLSLSPESKIIVISGPNAGGKTVTIKALGLLQMMLQIGMLIPVDPGSGFRLFNKICVDIGDHQSLERDLSTYASHLKSMSNFLNHIDKDSLILIDEFGTGTDPKLGGALAESILMAMHRKGVYGAITTHYSNLKVMAHRTKGISNGSLSFDQERLEPSYQFQIGIPGSSYAFEMAMRSGFDPAIIKQAKRNAGKKEEKLEDLINRLQEEKLLLEEKLISLQKKEKDLDKLIKNYERLHLEYDIKRKKLRREEKAQSLHHQAQLNRELEKTIQKIRETENLAEAKKLAASSRVQKKILTGEIESLDHELRMHKVASQKQKKYSIGDFVRVKMGGFVGHISEIRKNKVKIVSDHMVVNAEVQDIEHIGKPINRNPLKSVQVDLSTQSEIFHKIDIRGLKKEDAKARLEKFFDNALMANLHSLEVVHGRGNGILRELVKEKLKDYTVEFEIHHPKPESGGDGVSIVTIK